MKKFKKIIGKKSESSFKAMAPTVKYDADKVLLTSPISTSMEATINTYKIPGLIVVSIETEGLLTLYEPIGFMEDFENVAQFKVKDKEYQFFVVYDGHGGRDPKTGIKKGGKEVALWCMERLPTAIKETLEKYNNNNIHSALIESFEKADKELLKVSPENVGATAIVVLRDVEKGHLYFANLGDSRAVICKDGKVYFETEDSDWTNPRELKRIGITKDNQSYIIKTKSGEKKKFILNGKHLNGEKWNLATSRSFGDKHFKLDSDKPPVLAVPNVDRIDIDKEMKLILIASDGIWENGRGLDTEHFISKFLLIAKEQQPQDPTECLKKTCEEFVKWCMIDHLKLDFKNYGDNIALIAIGILDGQDEGAKRRWFDKIRSWNGKYGVNNQYLRGINDTIIEESQEDDYGSDSSSCKFDFTV